MKVLAIALIAAATLGCAKTAEQNNDSVDTKAGAPIVISPPPVPGAFTAADFRRLRWLEGKWRGFMPTGGVFYESYTFDNDSTIVKLSFADTTFTNGTDRSTISLRGTTIANESDDSRYVVTRMDSTGVDFSPERGARNHFTFTREDATKWVATLRWNDENGQPKTVVYALHRFGR